MLKKIMAKMGIGSAKVDLILHNNEYALGDRIEGELVIQGGAVEQFINKIDVDFVMNLRTKKQEHKQVVSSIPLYSSFTIHASERKAIPFTFQLSEELLVSSHMVSYYFVTNLDIAGGVDNQDNDYIRVVPPARFNNIIAAFEQLGLREKHDSRSFDGYTQEFEFFPTTFLREQVQEVEFIAAIERDRIRLLLEAELYSYGRKEVEIKQEISLPNDLLSNVQQLADYLQQVLQEMVENPEAYVHHRHSFGYGNGGHGHEHHRHGGFAGAIGGMAAGLLGGMVISELMDGMFGGDEGETESALGGGEEEADEGGFFDDMFGGEDE
ncbi:sporulation protein [Aneurinibacillus tyrosinisolvens]|uniref:sporulation protein n=1 Tax=Aneurinibacillus tyrosinisolvens TaxID=1443435 RepID=UPI00063F4091|nr:sporulation protein [Aneurinibacillus tyrosinisolvens]